MALKKLKKKTEELLRGATDSRGTKSYAEWLGAGKSDAADSAHTALAAKARRQGVGYGTEAEALAKGDLADDGYAAYLRRAAKDAREAGHRQIERERASTQIEALGKYAEYLDGERKKKADRLVALAEELAENDYTGEAAEALIEKSGAGREATGLLRLQHSYRTPYEQTPEGREKIASVLEDLRKSGMPYQRAYEYCRLLGFGDSLAERLARFAEAERSDLSRELEELLSR